MKSRRSLDDLREQFPALGFALYAFEPGGPVTLEVHADGDTFTFVESTEHDAIEMAFPAPEAAPEPVPQAPDTISVFD